MGDDKKQKTTYIGNSPGRVYSPTLKDGVANAKSELGKAFDWVTGAKKKKKKPGDPDETV